MINKYSLIAALLFFSSCSSLPDVSVPNIPFLDSNEADANSNAGAGADADADADADEEVVAQLVGYESRGDGYLSFTYNKGHLETIIVKLKKEQIVLSKGQNVIKKLPVGWHSFAVSGSQIDARSYSTELTYDGDTDEFIFDIPSQYSEIERRNIRKDNLDHSVGVLIVGSKLVNPVIELKKLDQPLDVLLLVCRIVENKDDPLKVGANGSWVSGNGITKGRITKIVKFKETCAYSDNVEYRSPLRMELPEGNYLLNASGRSKELYVDGNSVNTIEITENSFEVSIK